MDYNRSKYVIITLDSPEQFLYQGTISGSFSSPSGFDRNTYAARLKDPGKFYIVCKAVAAYKDAEANPLTFQPIKES